MNKAELIEKWYEEERLACIKGWDFSHINSRYFEDTSFPWDYREVIKSCLTDEMCLLDIDTGGGEFLLSLGHPHERTSATEGFALNVQLCRDTLLPLGIDFRQADAQKYLPFENESFDMVINRHGSFNPGEIYRVLKKGGIFITQQVGAENDRELVSLLFDNPPELPYPEQYLDIAVEKFKKCGFSIIRAEETYKSVKFFDIGALVWFARIIEWEFPTFSVENNLENLLRAQVLLDKNGEVDGRTHRFLLIAEKK